jgi:transposase
MARKNYTDEFRRQAVDLYESTPGATLKGIADDLGISRGTLSDWVKPLGTGSTTAPIISPHTPGRPETHAEKVARLEAENAQLRAEKAKIETEKSILRQAAKFVSGQRRVVVQRRRQVAPTGDANHRAKYFAGETNW